MNGMLEIMLFPIIFYRPTLVRVPQIKQFSLDSWCFLRILSFFFYLTNIVCHLHHRVTRAGGRARGLR